MKYEVRNHYVVREWDTGFVLCCGSAEYCAEQLGVAYQTFVNKATRYDDKRSMSLSFQRIPSSVFEVHDGEGLVAKVDSIKKAASVMGVDYHQAWYAEKKGVPTCTGFTVRRKRTAQFAAPGCCERYGEAVWRRMSASRKAMGL